MERICIAIDPEAEVTEVLNGGFSLARKLQAAVDIVTVIPREVDFMVAGSGLVNEDRWQVETLAMEELLKETKEKNSDLKIRMIVKSGDPRKLLLDHLHAGEYSYLVIGSHGRSALNQMVIGGTSQFLIRHCHMPVLVVPLVH